MTVLDRPAVNLRWDSGDLRLGGWAAPLDPENADGQLSLGLSIGPTHLGSVRRDQPRPDVDAHLGFPVTTPGFGIADYGLAAFVRVCGLEDLAVTVEADGLHRRFAYPIEERPIPYFAPLGTRHGVGKVVRLVDLWLEGSRNLNLRFAGSPKVPKSLDAYQRSPDGALVLLAGGREIRSVAALVTVTLLNPFEPLLLVFTGEDGAIDAIDVLPFPSLVRGGLHSPERLIGGSGADDLTATAYVAAELLASWLIRLENPENAVGNIELDPALSTGLEPALNEDLLAWLSRIGVSVRGADRASESLSAQLDTKAAPRRAGHTLRLPADCIPTFASILNVLPANARAQTLTGGMAVSESSRLGRVWSVWQPPFGESLEGLQLAGTPHASPKLTVGKPTGSRGQEEEVALNWPLAIAIRQPPTRVVTDSPFQIAPEIDAPLLRAGADAKIPTVSALILFDHGGHVPLPLLESLARQEAQPIENVVVCRPHGEANTQLTQALERLFKDRYAIVALAASAGRLEQIVGARDSALGEMVLILDSETVLPDPRHLQCLLPMLAIPDVASVGCLIRPADDKKGAVAAGYSLSQFNLHNVPAAVFDTIDPAVWRGPTTYPVVANSLRALLIRASALATLSPHGSSSLRPEADDLLTGLQLIERGGVNLCSTIVSAFSPSVARSTGLSLSSPYRISPEGIARIVQASTLVQRIA